MMKLINSNIIIYAAAPSYAYLRPLVKDDHNFASSVSRVEVLGYPSLSETEKYFFESVFQVLGKVHVTEQVIQVAIQLRQDRSMKLGDALIAASALIFDLEIYTRNVADFEHIPDLSVVNPIS